MTQAKRRAKKTPKGKGRVKNRPARKKNNEDLTIF